MAAEDNYKRLRAELDERLKADKRLRAIGEKIKNGKADFRDTAEYSQLVAHHLGEVVSENIGTIGTPMGKEMVCKALLRDQYEDINGVMGEVQASVDEQMGIHLSPVKAPFPAERVDKAAHSLEDPTVSPDTIKRRARSTTENITVSMHDDYIKENADYRTAAGLTAYIERTTDGSCCPWCSKVAGRYVYGPELSDDVFKRHDNCTCMVDYVCEKGRQDVWSKRWREPAGKAERIAYADGAEKPKVFSREQAERLNAEQVEKVRKFEPEINTVEAPASISTDYEKIARWEAENYKNKTESGLLIMPDGTEKAFGGIDHHVTGDKKDIELMKGAVFTHNHPTDNTFSQNDIVTGLVQGNLKEMRAVTSTGDIHILVNNGASDSDRRKFSAAYSQRRMKAANVADKKLRRGESIDKDSYIKESLEKFMAEHADEYNLSYSKGNVEEFYIDKSSKSGIIAVRSSQDFMGDAHKETIRMETIENGKRTIEEWSFKTYQLDGYPNIWTQTYSENAQAMAKYIDSKVNSGEYGDIDRVIIAKNKDLRGISSYDHVTNSLFISEELITDEGFGKIVDGTYFPARNLDDVITHELGGHKRHWDNVKEFYKNNKDKYIKLSDAKQDYERALRTYIVSQQNSDYYYISKYVSRNAHDSYIKSGKLNELIADSAVLRRNNNIPDDLLYEKIQEVMKYDDKTM